MNDTTIKKINIFIKTRDRKEEVRVTSSMQVLDLKLMAAERFGVACTHVRLIAGGSVLLDVDTLQKCGLRDGSIVHLLIRNDAMSRFDQLMPWLLRDNSDLMCQLLREEPKGETHLREVEMAQAIANPCMMQGLLSDILDPRYMDEVTRNYDIALRRVEDMPGGTDALESYYNFIVDLAKANDVATLLPNPKPKPTPSPSSSSNPSPSPSRSPSLSPPPPATSNPWTGDLVSQMLQTPLVQQLLLELAADPNFLQTFIDHMRQNMPNVMDDLGTTNGLRDYMAQMAQQRPAPPIQPPTVRYSNQLEQLQRMGFRDHDANLRALVRTFGNLNGALEILNRDE